MSHTIRATFNAGPALVQEMWRLHVITSPDAISAGRVIDLADGETTLGRSAGVGSNCLTIDDQRLSRRHAQLRVDILDKELEVEDLQSSNGTWIGGKRVTKRSLSHGSVLRIGNTVVVVERDGGTSTDFFGSIPGIPGQSELARGLRERVTSVARNFEPVLIIGPRGSGKGKLAREIHRQRGRVGNKVAVRMKEYTTDEALDVLFGGGQHTTGLLDRAQGGTLILEQIDRAPESLQIALRRLLSDTTRLAEYDARIIGLCSSSLLDLAERNDFDLRLAEMLSERAIEVPPLTARKFDLVSLGDAIAPLSGTRHISSWSSALDADAAEMLLHYRWPQNLSELKKVLNPLVHTIGSEGCGVEDLPADIIRDVKDSLHAKRPQRQHVASSPERPRYTAVQLCHLLAVNGGITPMATALGCTRDELIQMFREV